jgi:hypothetical protein
VPITFAVLEAALEQLPSAQRGQVLVRVDVGGASKAFVHHLTDAGLQYSIGFPAHGPVQAAIETIPEQAWVPALDSDGAPREGAQVAELTDWMASPVKPRAEDRIRCLKDTGLRNLPFHSYGANRIWLEIVALAGDLIARTQTLAFDRLQPARKWKPKRFRFRLLAVAGRIIRTGRQRRLRLPEHWPWNHFISTGWASLRTA